MNKINNLIVIVMIMMFQNYLKICYLNHKNKEHNQVIDIDNKKYQILMKQHIIKIIIFNKTNKINKIKINNLKINYKELYKIQFQTKQK